MYMQVSPESSIPFSLVYVTYDVIYMHEVNDMLCIVLIDLAKPLGVPSRNSVECDIDKDIKCFLSLGNVAAFAFCLYLASQLKSLFTSTMHIIATSLFYAKYSFLIF